MIAVVPILWVRQDRKFKNRLKNKNRLIEQEDPEYVLHLFRIFFLYFLLIYYIIIRVRVISLMTC